MDETSLIDACRQGDRKAQRELYDRHVESAYRLALRLTRSEQDAFDVAQDAFVQAFQHLSSFDNRSRFSTWLYRIVTNEALALIRRRGIERKHLARLQASESRRTSTTPAAHDVAGALARLPDTQRAILVLRYQQELDYEQIAAILGVAPGTVASRLNRARDALRKLLAEESAQAREESHTPAHPTDGEDGAARVMR